MNVDPEEKVQRLRRFAFSFLVACQNRKLDTEDIAHVLGFVSEVASAASGAEAAGAPTKEQFIQKIGKHFDFYRCIRNNPDAVEDKAKEVASVATSSLKH